MRDDENVLELIVVDSRTGLEYSRIFWEGELNSWGTGVLMYIINTHVNMFIRSMCLLDFVSHI